MPECHNSADKRLQLINCGNAVPVQVSLPIENILPWATQKMSKNYKFATFLTN